MKRNRRNVILQAPLAVGGAVVVVPSSFFVLTFDRLWIGRPDATQGGSGSATGHFLAGTSALRLFGPSRTKAKDHDRVAVMFETVISGYGLGMLSNHQRVFTVTRFA
jgi:hypothetical protein